MASEPKTTNVTDLSGAGSSVRAAAQTIGKKLDNAAETAESKLDEFADEMLPERKYSLNALVAAGIAGFILGRLFAR